MAKQARGLFVHKIEWYHVSVGVKCIISAL